MDNKNRITMIVCVLIVGIGLGYSACYYSNINTTEEQIEYVENLIDNPFLIDGLINENSTVKSIRAHYYHYDFISRNILEYQLERICGIKGEFNED